jgi:hypothetical protein
MRCCRWLPPFGRNVLPSSSGYHDDAGNYLLDWIETRTTTIYLFTGNECTCPFTSICTQHLLSLSRGLRSPLIATVLQSVCRCFPPLTQYLLFVTLISIYQHGCNRCFHNGEYHVVFFIHQTSLFNIREL